MVHHVHASAGIASRAVCVEKVRPGLAGELGDGHGAVVG